MEHGTTKRNPKQWQTHAKKRSSVRFSARNIHGFFRFLVVVVWMVALMTIAAPFALALSHWTQREWEWWQRWHEHQLKWFLRVPHSFIRRASKRFHSLLPHCSDEISFFCALSTQLNCLPLFFVSPDPDTERNEPGYKTAPRHGVLSSRKHIQRKLNKSPLFISIKLCCVRLAICTRALTLNGTPRCERDRQFICMLQITVHCADVSSEANGNCVRFLCFVFHSEMHMARTFSKQRLHSSMHGLYCALARSQWNFDCYCSARWAFCMHLELAMHARAAWMWIPYSFPFSSRTFVHSFTHSLFDFHFIEITKP